MERNSARAELKRQNTIKRIVLACSVVIVVVLAGIGTTKLTHHFDNGSAQISQTVKTNKKKQQTNELSLVMVGDNLIHMPLISDAQEEDGSLNFDGLYAEMASYFQAADLSVIVQETILGGKSLGYSGYPLFNSPQEVGDAVANAGFDIVLSATNHALDTGEKGIVNTLEFWKKYPDVTVLGLNQSQEDYDAVKYIEKNGIKLAVLNYTDSTNGISPPKSKEYLVNKVNRDKIEKDLHTAEENADFTVVFMHWGTEYRFSADDGQKDLAHFMTEHGADLIMGSHPHVVEPAEWIETENGGKALVFYSLGNYVSRQKEAANLVGAMGKVKICSNEERGTYIDSASVMPTVTHYNANSREFRVYPLKNYTDELAEKHGVAQYDGKVSVDRFKKVFDDVFGDCTAVTVEN